MDGLLLYLLKSAGCLTFFYVAYWLLLKNDTFFALNRFYLVISLLASFAIPLFPVTSPFRKAPAVTYYGTLPEGAAPVKTLQFTDILLIIYLVGAGLLLCRFLIQLWRLYSLVRAHRIERDNGCYLVLVDQDTQAFSFFKYVFLSKARTAQPEVQRILEHERVHIKQYHSLDILLMEFATIVQWFNPFVWPYKTSLKEIHEYLADYGVIAQGCSTPRYQLLIIEQQVGGKLFELANNFRQSQIKRRITMMSKIKSKGWAKLKILLVLPLTVLLVLVLAQPKVQAADDSADRITVQDQTKKEDFEKKKAEYIKKLKAESAEIAKKREMLKNKLAQTDDPDTKKKLKQMLAEMDMKEKALKMKATELKMNELEMQLAEADNGKDKAKLEKELKELKMALAAEENGKEKKELTEKAKEEELKILEMKIKELETAYKNTDNPEKKEKIKVMLKELKVKQKELQK